MCVIAVDGIPPDAKLLRFKLTAKRTKNAVPAASTPEEPPATSTPEVPPTASTPEEPPAASTPEEPPAASIPEKQFNSLIDIKPGTDFMKNIEKRPIDFIIEKQASDTLWRDIKFVFSGHTVQGEGEHKVMDFVRDRRSQPDYNHLTRHCFLSKDSDAIILALASHEPFFSVLREEVNIYLFYLKNHLFFNTCFPYIKNGETHLIHVSAIREYIYFEFSELADELPFDFCLERIIDDTVSFILFS